MSTELMKFLAAVVMYAAWGALVYLGKTDVGPFVGFTMAALGAILGHSSATVSRAVPSGVGVTQGGFARPLLLAIIALLAGLSLLAGCTTTTASVYSGLYTQARAGVQVFDDNTLGTMHDLICAQPYSAIQRHPELQPGIVALCGPLVNTASLDPAQVTRMLDIAKQLGITAAAAPAAAASVAK